MNYSNLLAKCFHKHNLFHLTRTIMWDTYRGDNMILNIYGSNVSNPGVSGFDGLIQNVDGA